MKILTFKYKYNIDVSYASLNTYKGSTRLLHNDFCTCCFFTRQHFDIEIFLFILGFSLDECSEFRCCNDFVTHNFSANSFTL